MSRSPREVRRKRRTPCRQAAWIRPGEAADSPSLPCVLWDQSHDGARIFAAHASKLPSVFALLMADKKTVRRCRVVWKKGSQMGVRFLQPGESGVDPPSKPRGAADQPAAAVPAALPPGFYRPGVADALSQNDRGQFEMWHAAAAFLVALIAATGVFYVAGIQSAEQVPWAAAVCQEARSFCEHPEFSGGASILMAVVCFALKGMEL